MAETNAPISAPSSGATQLSLLEDAKTAWTLGLAAMGLAMISLCGGGVTLLVALPIGIMAMSRAKAILEGGVAIDGATEAYARTARVSGLMASIWSGILLAMLALFILLYVGMFAVMFGAIAAIPQPPPTSP